MSDWAQLHIAQQANMEYIYPHLFAARETLEALDFVCVWYVITWDLDPIYYNTVEKLKTARY